MSNQLGNTQDGGPLFQNTDEQEQVYAPQQVPGTAMPAEEVDRGGTAGEATAGDDAGTPVMPIAAVGAAGLAAGPGVGTAAAVPVIGAAALSDTNDDGDVTGPDRS
jgi:hypothetical protein